MTHKTLLIAGLICVNVYAQDNDNEFISKPSEFYVATAHIDGNASYAR